MLPAQLKHVALPKHLEKVGSRHLQVAMFDRCIMHPDPWTAGPSKKREDEDGAQPHPMKTTSQISGVLDVCPGFWVDSIDSWLGRLAFFKKPSTIEMQGPNRSA